MEHRPSAATSNPTPGTRQCGYNKARPPYQNAGSPSTQPPRRLPPQRPTESQFAARNRSRRQGNLKDGCCYNASHADKLVWERSADNCHIEDIITYFAFGKRADSDGGHIRGYNNEDIYLLHFLARWVNADESISLYRYPFC